VIDVYHAILVTARDRELISDDDFAGYYKEAKAAIRTEHEVIKDEIDNYFQTGDPANDFKNEAEIEAEKEKYWKCPSCNQLVEMEFGVCWNCKAEIPETVEHPDTEEIIKERTAKNTFNPIKSGFILIGTGILVGLLGFVRTYYSHFRYGRFVFGAFIFLIGTVFVISGLFFKSKLKVPPGS
jgi:hypothetical protein